MIDIFDHKILCKKCNTIMEQVTVIRNGFKMRALVCPFGHDKIVHPQDEVEYKKFKELKEKKFKVKMRIVGNSYTVSIPKEIVSFIQDKEKTMDDMVRLCFEEAGKLSLSFGDKRSNNLE